MKKTAKILMLIWNIFLLPCIVFAASAFFDIPGSITDVPLLGSLCALTLLLVYLMQQLFLPQIISIAVIVVYAVTLCKERCYISMKKELPQFLLLTLWCSLGAVCAFAMILIQDGTGVPLS